MSTLATEPVGIGQVLDAGIRLYISSFKSMLPLIAILIAISVLLSIGVPLMIGDGGAPAQPLGWNLIVSIVAGLANTLIYASLVHMLWSCAEQSGSTAGSSIGVGLRKLLYIILFWVLYALACVGGTILLLIPGIYLMVSLGLGLYLIVIEDLGAIDSLKRSHALVRGNWWRTAAIYTVFAIIFFALYIVLMVTLGVAVLMNPEPGSATFMFYNLSTSIVNPLIQPLGIAIGLVLLNDLRIRKEGGDLGAAIEQL